MLLIRPWIRMNKYRITAHHIVFFIFIVSNVGGCLTPIGDPPLFLGYLKGIPFWWVAEHCWPMWAVGVGFLLALFYVIDTGQLPARPPGGSRAAGRAAGRNGDSRACGTSPFWRSFSARCSSTARCSCARS